MFNILRFLLELLVVGVVMVIVGLPVTWVGMKIGDSAGAHVSLKTWASIGVTLFVIGCLVHGLFEVSGMNAEYVKYYCKN